MEPHTLEISEEELCALADWHDAMARDAIEEGNTAEAEAHRKRALELAQWPPD